MAKTKKAEPEAGKPERGYTVLARRYRPKQFAELLGQEPVARALVNALESNRVAHAYLFTGARGVGKTSAARILAKALNCERGPTPTPCDQCDLCRSIASGEDVDVLEIDGASNRGIDEVREIRQNVQYRPGRARFKIYIIDEVHMLTPPAFNALLKTLEEPPPHVKFIFATTEAQRIPVTILSRCQRFDFAGIGTPRIVARLKEITTEEGAQADDDALEQVARRAGGSMRDAQSLLDQLLAFGSETKGARLTVEQVHRLLGTANDDRVAALAGAVLEHDAKHALEALAQAADEGIQLGELLDQLIEYWRDLMLISCAGKEARDVSVPARLREVLDRQAAALHLDTILAGLDILATTKARLRGSQHGRVLLEMALVRLGRLEELVSLTQLAQALERGSSTERGAPSAQRRAAGTSTRRAIEEAAASAPTRRVSEGGAGSDIVKKKLETDLDNGPGASFPEIWRAVMRQVGPMLAGELEKADDVAQVGPNTLVLRFPARYNLNREHCQEAGRLTRILETLKKITGSDWALKFETAAGGQEGAVAQAPVENSQARYRRQRTEAMQTPLVKRAMEVLGAQIVHVDEGFGSVAEEGGERTEATEGES